jgi:hypothetical protein
MLARLKTSGGVGGGLARLVGSTGLSVPFFIRGTTSDPAFSPDVAGAAAGLLNPVDATGTKTAGSPLTDALRNLLGKKKK